MKFDEEGFIKYAEKLDNDKLYKEFAHAKLPNTGEPFSEISRKGLGNIKKNKNKILGD